MSINIYNNGSLTKVAGTAGTQADYLIAKEIITTNGTIQQIYEKLKGTSGGTGSTYLFPSGQGQFGQWLHEGWYNYIYIPHRNGQGNGDNPKYGTLLLFPMTFSGFNWIFRISGGVIAEEHPIATNVGSRLDTLEQLAANTDNTSWASALVVKQLQSNFQAGVDSIYNAVVAKGTTPASKSLSDVVAGIGNISVMKVAHFTSTGTYYLNDSTKSYYFPNWSSLTDSNIYGKSSFSASETRKFHHSDSADHTETFSASGSTSASYNASTGALVVSASNARTISIVVVG